MTQFRFLPGLLAAPAVLLVASFAHAIAAPEPQPGCGSGPACAYGFECTMVGSSGCAPTPTCAPDTTCPEPVPCETKNEYACTPAHCQTDADCTSGMVCHAWTEPCAVSDCACAPNEQCDCGAPTTCEPTTVSMCTPRYLLPCETAVDCGPGFSCEETQSCGCSGSSGSATPGSEKAAPAPPAGGGAPATDPIPPDCTCEPSGQKQCVAQELTCQSDAECPAGWSCEQEVLPSAPACDGGNCDAVPAPTPTRSLCQPAYYGGETPSDLQVPGVPESTGDGKGTTAGSDNPATDGNASGSGDAQSNESSACQFGPATSPSGGFGLLAVLGALFGLARRRNVR
jgi:MYXO-CTERM domain-containing protein